MNNQSLKYGFEFDPNITESIERNYWSNGKIDIEQIDEHCFQIVSLEGHFCGEEKTLEEAIERAQATLLKE